MLSNVRNAEIADYTTTISYNCLRQDDNRTRRLFCSISTIEAVCDHLASLAFVTCISTSLDRQTLLARHNLGCTFLHIWNISRSAPWILLESSDRTDGFSFSMAATRGASAPAHFLLGRLS